jgi:hypothetical protein
MSIAVKEKENRAETEEQTEEKELDNFDVI